MSINDTPIDSNEAKKISKFTIPGTSSPKVFYNTPPKSTDLLKRQERQASTTSATTNSPVSALSSYLKHLLGLNAKTTKRSINEGNFRDYPKNLKLLILLNF